jgi:hypothetical protein
MHVDDLLGDPRAFDNSGTFRCGGVADPLARRPAPDRCIHNDRRSGAVPAQPEVSYETIPIVNPFRRRRALLLKPK